MTDSPHSSNTVIPEAILEDAAIWQARLRECEPDSLRGNTLHEQFQQWLAEDERHVQAYREMEITWTALEAPVSDALDQKQGSTVSTTDQYQQSLWTRFATAACLVLTLTAGVGWQSGWFMQWRSDYMTAIGEQAPVQLSDGSQITLNSASALAVDFSTDKRTVSLFEGEAWFDVATDRSRPFVVNTPHGKIIVTGTRFNVRLDADNARVSLREGQVLLQADSDKTVSLLPGQQAKLTGSGISPVSHYDHTIVSAWQRDQLVFYNADLQDVVKELNRQRKGHILITSEALHSLKVSGIFSTRDPDAALNLMLDTLEVKQTRISDYLVLLHQ